MPIECGRATSSLEEGARAVAEQLTRDAGYDPVYVGGLDRARALEDHLARLMVAALQGGHRPVHLPLRQARRRLEAPGR